MELLIFLFKSGLPTEEQGMAIARRADLYRRVKGLMQKYYVIDRSSGHVGGVFVFDSKENLELFRDSDLAKSTGEAYKFTEPPSTRVLNIFRVLRDAPIATEQMLSPTA